MRPFKLKPELAHLWFAPKGHGSISPTFYKQLLLKKISKAQKDTDD